ncbi:MAG: DNA repair protein RadA [Candidatus Nomurabacteria bacterium]|jgi:DNA repair protein RadA/Sms|nr:DNA repair protein RadA [Candidatus Nomurabacteria bacterium]
MAKIRANFVCQQCGASFAKWMGKCEQCGAWNSLLEQAPAAAGKSVVARSLGKVLNSQRIQDVATDTVERRISTGIGDLDEVLGGGLMPGGVVLVAGQPGIGKSTLLMQVAATVANRGEVLYVSGEESASQVKLRAERLIAGFSKDSSAHPQNDTFSSNAKSRHPEQHEGSYRNSADKNSRHPELVSGSSQTVDSEQPAARGFQNDKSSESTLQLDLAASTSADDVAATIATGRYKLVVVDSMQTMQMNEVASAPGTVSQITNSANIIIRAAKATGTAVLLVGHVTKEGSIAGPKVLEHIVDVVLSFEGDRYGGFKLVRAVKNRYGSTSEAAIFDMTDKGLEIVKNPSAALLAERRDLDGSVVLATLEGNRPLLVEIQALVNPTSFGYPGRTSSGFDLNRLKLLIAVLERRTKLKLSDKDVFINVVGGLKIQDPAADLAVCMAIASAAAGRKLGDGAVVFGEVGLGGEIRSARMVDKRIKEAKKLGFKFAIAPKTAAKGKFVIPATDLRDALNQHLKK